MSTLRPLTAEAFAAPAEPVAAGAVPMLGWLKISDLRVDASYQREIGDKGKTTIRSIVGNFLWSRFAPVVVAPIEGGLYAIIDGQHRTTAALICGFDQVPCAIVIADRTVQADAFAAINGAVTAIHATQIFHAKVAAGDPAAMKVMEICREAEVVVLRHPRQANQLKAGETLAIGTLTKCANHEQADVLALALRCITQTGDGNPGLLRAAVIGAFFDVLCWHPKIRTDVAALLDALDDFPFAQAWVDSAFAAPGEGGTASWRYTTRIIRHLEQKLPEVA